MFKIKLTMKKILSIVFFAYVFFSCNTPKGYNALTEEAASVEEDYEINETERGIIDAKNLFSIKLFKKIAASQKGKNVLISPLGVMYILDMLKNGAETSTKATLEQATGLEAFQLEDINDLNHRMMLAHACMPKHTMGEPSSLKSATLFLHKKNNNVKEKFLDIIGETYYADNVSFDNSTDACKKASAWLKMNAKGFDYNSSLNLDSKNAYLINAIVFNGPWIQEFMTNNTKLDTFYISKEKTELVDMMSRTDDTKTCRYCRCENYSILHMLYTSGFSIDVILPHENVTLDTLLSKFSLDDYYKNEKKLSTYTYVTISLPKFKVESDISMKPYLINLGLGNIFSENACFGSMSETPIAIDDVKQKIKAKVDETGTYIETLTSTSFVEIGASEDVTWAEFEANRPFLYLIKDHFGSICFIGTYYGKECDDRPLN